MKEIVFKNPEYFFLFLGFIPLIAWYIWKHRTIYPAYKISGGDVFNQIKPSWRVHLRHIPFVLRLLVFSAIIVALCRPQTFDSWQDSSIEGIDIVIVNDVSLSMLATDFKPNRLQVALDVVKSFIKKRPYDRIGLVIFAGESLTQCPLTTDHTNLLYLVDQINPRLLKDGTAIGMGLATAVNRLRQSDASSKVIVLMTDGVNNQGSISPQTAGELARSQNIKVYTIGVGTPQASVMTPQGTVKADFDEKVLKEIANQTGGKYFEARDKNTLNNIYEEIDQMEKSELDITEYQNSQEEFYLFLALGLAFLALEILLRNTILSVMA
jgi:Ca-activated chloride channel family protein